jgi:hypothetical protein
MRGSQSTSNSNRHLANINKIDFSDDSFPSSWRALDDGDSLSKIALADDEDERPTKKKRTPSLLTYWR